jgi:hypothetical protein
VPTERFVNMEETLCALGTCAADLVQVDSARRFQASLHGLDGLHAGGQGELLHHHHHDLARHARELLDDGCGGLALDVALQTQLPALVPRVLGDAGQGEVAAPARALASVHAAWRMAWLCAVPAESERGHSLLALERALCGRGEAGRPGLRLADGAGTEVTAARTADAQTNELTTSTAFVSDTGTAFVSDASLPAVCVDNADPIAVLHDACAVQRERLGAAARVSLSSRPGVAILGRMRAFQPCIAA